jgi:hypothetical protein
VDTLAPLVRVPITSDLEDLYKRIETLLLEDFIKFYLSKLVQLNPGRAETYAQIRALIEDA